MLRALFLSLMNLALAAMAMAQTNLVLNGSFEDTVDCGVATQCLLMKAVNWYNPNIATPDVWDADLERGCGYDLDPEGFPGLWYLAPFQGLRHAGAYYWFGPGSGNTREYLMTRLAQPLEVGVAYEVSLRYALSGTFRYAVDHIGVWLGHDSLFENTPNWLSVTPQLRLRDPQHTYLAETEAWTLLKDTLVASGGEQWLVIGNFDVASMVNGILAHPDAFNAYAYYYLDSVSVREVVLPTTVVEHGITAAWSSQGVRIGCSPAMRVEELCLLDGAGRMIAQVHSGSSGSQGMITTPPLAPGLYIVRVLMNGRWAWTKFVKEEGEF